MRLARWTTVLGVLGVFTIYAVALALALSWGANDRGELAAVVRSNCIQIESLKSELRRQAVESYERLLATAARLGRLTPELRAAALDGRDRTLARFAAGEC